MTPGDPPAAEESRAPGPERVMRAAGLVLLLMAIVWMTVLLRMAPVPVSQTDSSGEAPSIQEGQALAPLLGDEAFGVELPAQALRRVVQMLQWRQVGVPLAPGEEVAFEQDGYQRVWSERVIDSTAFDVPEGHLNPPAPPYRSQSFGSAPVDQGGERGWQRLSPQDSTLPDNLAAVFRAEGLWWTSTPEHELPQVGDLRVRFEWLELPEHASDDVSRPRAGAQVVPDSVDTITVALRWIARAAAFILAMLGAGLALRGAAGLASPGSALARMGSVALLAISAWIGVGGVLLALVLARLP